MPEAERLFVLAISAVEALHGEAVARLLLEHAMDTAKRTCVIDATTDVGWDFTKLFTQFLTREFGPDSFAIERIDNSTGA